MHGVLRSGPDGRGTRGHPQVSTSSLPWKQYALTPSPQQPGKEDGVEGHPDFLSPAQTHAEIVLRFGRYPHRNAIVGRESTAEELEYLAQNHVVFGQSKRG